MHIEIAVSGDKNRDENRVRKGQALLTLHFQQTCALRRDYIEPSAILVALEIEGE
jgi:hypothetical protein